MAMATENIGWLEIKELALEYKLLVKKGFGTSVKNRCDRQKHLVNELIDRTVPYLYQIANELLFGRGIRLTNGRKTYVVSLRNINVSPEVLVNEGALGIIKRIKNYDPEKGEISTFIMANAGAEMYMSTIRNHHILNVSAYAYQKLRTIEKVYDDDKTGCIDKVRSEFQISSESAELLLASMRGIYQEINGPIGDRRGDMSGKNGYGHYNEIGAKNGSPFKSLELEEMTKKVKGLLSDLSHREREIIRMRFGFENDESTLEEIGEKFHVTRERIRQLEKKTLGRLRVRGKKECLDAYL
jgi:RNA polymerase primary sigma factor